MDRVRIEDVESRVSSASVQRSISAAVDAEHVALNYYELDPGESFAYGYHRHDSQEELFVVQSGRVTFETESGDVVLEAGDVVRFAPGEFQRGVNSGETRVTAFAIGAPQETGETEVRRFCEACGERTPTAIERVDDGGAKVTRCLRCDSVTGRFE
jgi:uncharacterized cupin superfamily protein